MNTPQHWFQRFFGPAGPSDDHLEAIADRDRRIADRDRELAAARADVAAARARRVRRDRPELRVSSSSTSAATCCTRTTTS